MVFWTKKKTKRKPINLMFVDGLNYYPSGHLVILKINDEDQVLEISSRFGIDKPVVKLKFEQITGVELIDDKEIIEKSKSVAGRAVLGGLVLGPLGAIVGGMSGMGDKKTTELKYYIVVNYKSKEGNIEVMSFEIPKGTLDISSFIIELRNASNVEIQKEIAL